VAADPPSERELDAIREQADAFMAERDEEEYLHFAGHKPEYDLAPIYERHADLTSLDMAQRVGLAVDGRRNLELWRFTCEGYLGGLTREHVERVAGLEASLTLSHDGSEIGYRMVRETLANDPEKGSRQKLQRARDELTDEHLNPVYAESWQTAHEGARALGARSYLELYRDRFGIDLDGLAAQCRALLDSTERLYEDAMDTLLRRRVGVSLEEADSWDLPRFFRAATWDDGFPADRMMPALRRLLRDLGIDIDAQPNVHLDVEPRPTKDPRAFCSPIEVPGRVMLVIKPMGGPDDWHALFHEAGHTEHFANTSPSLPVEERKLGDNAVTEGWAALFDLLVADAAWLTHSLDFGRPHEFEQEEATVNLYFARRYSAKLLYELELHAADDVTALRPRYAELLGDATKIDPSPASYLLDVDAGFYAVSYIRSWAFEAQLRSYLRERWGSEWFTRREAGSLLRELWELGQQPTADELLKDVTGAELELASVEERVRESIR
jgi:hypothetical protein